MVVYLITTMMNFLRGYLFARETIYTDILTE